jgi:hypothetical protein
VTVKVVRQDAKDALTQTVNVSDNGMYSTTNTTFVARAEGHLAVQVDYSGDTNNRARELGLRRRAVHHRNH